jgi:beta-lactam-binding protein with PASTA domain
MPRLVGLPLTEAESVVERYGLTLADVKYVVHSRAAPLVVLGQYPALDATVMTGGRVSVSVNRRGISRRRDTRLVIVDHSVGGTPDDVVHVKIVLQDGNGRHVLVNTNEAGGTHISRPWTAVGTARLIVYEDNMRAPIREEQLP